MTFKVSWQAGGWVGEYHGGRGTNANMTYYVAEHVMVNPLQMKDNFGERKGRKRETPGLGAHLTRWTCIWTRMGFCAPDNLNASNSTLHKMDIVNIQEMIKIKHYLAPWIPNEKWRTFDLDDANICDHCSTSFLIRCSWCKIMVWFEHFLNVSDIHFVKCNTWPTSHKRLISAPPWH